MSESNTSKDSQRLSSSQRGGYVSSSGDDDDDDDDDDDMWMWICFIFLERICKVQIPESSASHAGLRRSQDSA